VLADRIALNAGGDLAMLSLEPQDHKRLGADLNLLRFIGKELAELLCSDVCLDRKGLHCRLGC
jgi:hypothetical protein